MTVVGLHPEELFDKLLDGELTSAERERLEQHLDSCSVCRFEHATRLDFQAEALAMASPPPALPLRGPLPASAPAPSAQAARGRRRRSRRVVWGLAAAALITASGAVAAGLVGAAEWHPLSALFAPRAPSTSQPAPLEHAPSSVATKLGQRPSRAAPVTEAAVDAAPVVVALPASAAHAGGTRMHAQAAKKVEAPSGAARVLAAVSPAHAEMTSAKDTAAKDPAAAKEPTSAARLFSEANQARRSGDVGRAAGLYHLLQDQFPGSSEADLSRVTLALLLLDSGDAQGALSGFERYLAGSSRGLEAEALVGRARSLGRLGRQDLEASAWKEVQRKYPRSIYGRQATERLLALGQP